MKFIEAVLILSGMIIGVGMFGIPFSFVGAGFWLGVTELIVLGVVVTLLHLFYGEVVLNTADFHRMPGYVLTHLGHRAAVVSRLSATFGILGTLLAYIVIQALFLQNIFQSLLPGFSEFFWAAASVALGAIITAFSLKKEAFINGILTIFEIGFIVSLIIFLMPHVDTTKLVGFHSQNLFFPYGVLLFALSGGIVIPDIITIVGRDRKLVRGSIIAGSSIPVIIYFVFALAVVGSVGTGVSEEAISGLIGVVGEKVVIWGSLAGFFAVITSFITLGANFQEMLKLDFKVVRPIAWLLSFGVPFLLYIIGFNNFVYIIGAVGAIAVGIDSALVIAMYRKIKKKAGLKISGFSNLWQFLIYVMILGGVVYEIIKFFGIY